MSESNDRSGRIAIALVAFVLGYLFANIDIDVRRVHHYYSAPHYYRP